LGEKNRGAAMYKTAKELYEYRDVINRCHAMLLDYRKISERIDRYEGIKGLLFGNVMVSGNNKNTTDKRMAKCIQDKEKLFQIDGAINHLSRPYRQLFDLLYRSKKVYQTDEICSLTGMSGDQFFDMLFDSLYKFSKFYKGKI